MDSLMKNVKNVYSFKTNVERYTLDKINFYEVRRFLNLMQSLLRLERENKIKIITRGFSIKNEDGQVSSRGHNIFLEDELNKFFIVGQKGAHYLHEQILERQQLYNYNMNNREQLIIENERLFHEANKILEKKKKEKLDDILLSNLYNLSLHKLQNIKIFLTAFLHNIGRAWADKISSPLLSFSYGPAKKETALRFATGNRNGCPQNDGFIILGYIPMRDNSFIKLTNDLNLDLEKLGVDWYEDIHTEVMLLDGIMPQRIIGIFDVRANGEEDFIANPWLIKMFEEKRQFFYKQGIKINQERFNDYAEGLKYGGYILEMGKKRFNGKFGEDQIYEIPGELY